MARLRISGTFFLIIGLVCIVGSNLFRTLTNERIRPTPEQLRSVLPEADRFEPDGNYYRGYAPDGKPAGVAFLTSRVPPRFTGFTSEIDTLVGMTPEGVISRLEIIHHDETPSYIRMILDAGLLSAFPGVEMRSGFPDIEAVSGATLSSEALIRDIQSSASAVARAAYGMEIPPLPELAGKSRWYLDCLLVLLLFLSVALARKYRHRRLRSVPLLLGFLGIGLYLNSPLSLNHLVNLASLHPPSLLRHPGLFTLLFLTLAVTLASGNHYCSHLCPFAGVLELGAAVVPPKIQVSPEWLRRGQVLRYAILFLVTVGIFGLGGQSLAYLEPYPYLFAGTANVFLWLYISLTVIFSVVSRRLWCRNCCPTGAFLDLLARVKLRKGRGDHNEKRG